MNTIVTRTDLTALNPQQRQAVLSDKKRILVLAGAGSGKTNTLLQKIHYLINDKQADAKSILAITFTKNAANEMVDRMILSTDKTGFYKKVLETNGIKQEELSRERIKMLDKYPWLKQITIKTFHSFCYQIMRDEGVNVFDNRFKIVPKAANSSSDFIGNTAVETESEIAKKIAITLSDDINYLLALKRYIVDYYVDRIKEKEADSEFRPEGKFFTTLKNDKVRSKSEQYIADWLYCNNIEYVYEKKERVDKFSFHPDFFIPAANLYLEHVSALSHPTFWKEMELKKGGITCIKTFDKATHNSTDFNKMLDCVVRGRITEKISTNTSLNYSAQFDGYKKELASFFRMVLDVKGTIKTSDKSLDEIAMAASSNEHERVRNFYRVALPIINGYYDYCINRSYLDFDDLIAYSIKLLKEHPETKKRYQNQFKYVMVDEFQDVNNQQVVFLKELVNSESQLFCVGDDWQSIYGFRGSVIDYIVNFKEHFKNPEIIKLNLNYRSTDFIVKASNEVIKNNKFQVSKKVSAVQKGGAKIEVNYAEKEGDTESFIWEKIVKHIDEGIPSEEILVLYRRTAMKIDVEKKLKKAAIHNVQFKTIHGAKGLEAKVVFILGLNSARGGFPDPWMQDKIYHVIKKTAYDTLLEEERRLFYVALTRAKSHLYLMSQKGNVSQFIKEIPKDLLFIKENEVTGLTFEFSTCVNCSSKIEEMFKFCPECGLSLKKEKEVVENKVLNFSDLKAQIKKIPLKHTGFLDDHIYKARLVNARAYESWQELENTLLKDCFEKYTLKELSILFCRSEAGVKTRLKQLKLIDGEQLKIN